MAAARNDPEIVKVLIMKGADINAITNVQNVLLYPNWLLEIYFHFSFCRGIERNKTKQFFYKILSSLGLMKWSFTMVQHLLPKPYSAHLKKAGFHDCTHAYAITQEAAKILLKAQTPVVYRADDLLSATIMKGELKAFVTQPKFFDQEIFHNAAITSEIKL